MEYNETLSTAETVRRFTPYKTLKEELEDVERYKEEEDGQMLRD
jgi:hypothetical protein